MATAARTRQLLSQRPQIGERLLARNTDCGSRLAARHRRVPGLILKIETARAVGQAPELIVAAAAHLPVGLMIARGDLLEALAVVDDVCRRMQAHQHKKTPRLRALAAWS